MINYTTGDLLQSGAQALVNTVNTVGVMGKGIALHFKETFPHNFAVYADACRRGQLAPGRMLVVEDSSLTTGKRLIVNFPTKQHWRNPSRYEWVESGLQDLVRVIAQYHITSIAIPPLGCGNGGLDWNKVKPMIEHIRQLLRLIDGYESAYALEVLASVAYVRSQEPGISLDDTLQRIEGWSQRKRDLFKREHIEAAYRHLDTMMA